MATLPRPMLCASAGLLAALVLTSCGSDTPDKTDTSAADPSATTSSEPSTSTDPSASSDPSTLDSATVTSAPPPSTATPSGTPVDDLFLTAAEMPGLNDVTVWKPAGTTPEGADPFGDCAKFTLVDSGADGAWVRRFTADGNQRAAQLIATFADAKSAWRAEQVLKAWHETCADRLDAEVEKIGPLAPAKVDGKAFSYLVQWGDDGAQDHHFNGTAVNRVGSRISVVLIDNLGQDYNYEPGREPAHRAAEVVAAKLG